MSVKIPQPVQDVINHCGITRRQLIGKGGEGYVFNYSEDTVMKVYPKATKTYLEELVTLQQMLAKAHLPYKTPQILTIKEFEGIYYTIEHKLAGQTLDTIFPKLSTSEQYLALHNFINAIKPLKAITVSHLPYGQIVTSPDIIQTKTWSAYLNSKLDQQIAKSDSFLKQDVSNYAAKVIQLKAKIHQLFGEITGKNFVHLDYYLNNVLVDQDLNISAVLDFSSHAVVGDHRADLASICFLSLNPNITKSHLKFTNDLVVNSYGQSITPYLNLYALFYAFYYSCSHDFDPLSYQWCLSLLNDDNRWQKIPS